jgi:hypothetical protein
MVRRIVWSPTFGRLMPRAGRLSFWRLSLIVSDGFWFDASKFVRAYPKRLRTLEEALPDLLREDHRERA